MNVSLPGRFGLLAGALIAAALPGRAAPPSPTPALANGNFEEGSSAVSDSTAGFLVQNPDGWFSFNGQTYWVTSGCASFASTPAQEGNNFAVLQAAAVDPDGKPIPDAMMHPLNLTRGETYQVTWWVRASPGSSPGKWTVGINNNGKDVTLLKTLGTGTATTSAWTKCTATYVAADATPKWLSLQQASSSSDKADGGFTFYDNVSVTPVKAGTTH